MSELSAREILAQAIWSSSGSTDSSWGFVNEKRRGEYRHQADCALKAIGANGYAVVELPEVDGELYDTLSDFFIFMNHGSSLPITTSEGGDVHRTAKDAREYAAHLLLAATAAERDSGER